MDTMIKGIDLDEKILLPIINEIININSDDEIVFEITKTKDIRLEDNYGGIKVYLMGKKEHLQVPLSIDITTKDPITPRELVFRYKCMFTDNYINVMTFSLETIIAEKLETLLHDLNNNTRAKDYYDLYMLIHYHYNEINEENLIKAIKNTRKRRNTLEILSNIKERFELMKNSIVMNDRWNKYCLKYEYAKDISYINIINEIEKIVDAINNG